MILCAPSWPKKVYYTAVLYLVFDANQAWAVLVQYPRFANWNQVKPRKIAPKSVDWVHVGNN